MAAKTNLTDSAAIAVTAREIDFVTQFARNFEALEEILGIVRPIEKVPGTVLKSKTATVTLADSVGEGEEIPYSKAEITEQEYAEITIEKYAKGVSIEAINAHGYDNAVAETDREFMYELQDNVTSRFYSYLQTGTLVGSEATWKKCLAKAKGAVLNQFKAMHRTVTDVVGFVNVMDLYDYLGDVDISVQSAFGFQYLTDFLGYSTVILLGDTELESGKVIAVPVENIDLYYVNPAASDFASAGLEFTTDGDTNLIGFHTQGNYNTDVSECFALMGITLFSEYINGIAVYDVSGE